MARREDIDTAMWSDPDFLALSGYARYLYLWSFTNHRCCMAGIYKVPRQAIVMETGIDGKHLDRALADLQDGRFLFYDGYVLFVRSRIKYLRSRSHTIAKSMKADLDSIAGHPFVALWWRQNANQGWITDEVEKPIGMGDSDGVSIGHREPIDGLPGTGKGNGMARKVGGVGGGTKRPRVDQEQVPDRLDDRLVALVDPVLEVLTRCYGVKGGDEPTRRGVGLALNAFPRRDHVGVALRVEHWATAGSGRERKQKDWVALYRNFLDSSPDAAPTRSLAPVQQITARKRVVESQNDWQRFYPEDDKKEDDAA